MARGAAELGALEDLLPSASISADALLEGATRRRVWIQFPKARTWTRPRHGPPMRFTKTSPMMSLRFDMSPFQWSGAVSRTRPPRFCVRRGCRAWRGALVGRIEVPNAPVFVAFGVARRARERCAADSGRADGRARGRCRASGRREERSTVRSRGGGFGEARASARSRCRRRRMRRRSADHSTFSPASPAQPTPTVGVLAAAVFVTRTVSVPAMATAIRPLGEAAISTGRAPPSWSDATRLALSSAIGDALGFEPA